MLRPETFQYIDHQRDAGDCYAFGAFASLWLALTNQLKFLTSLKSQT